MPLPPPPTPVAQVAYETHPKRNIIIFVADGLRHGSVNPTDAPTMCELRQRGVDFVNSHSLFPTFTTPNAVAIATGHAIGDTGEFANSLFTGFPINTEDAAAIANMEHDPALMEVDDHFGGNYLTEEAFLAFAHAQGYATAAVGKLGPTLLQEVTQAKHIADNSAPETIIIDDATGKQDTDGQPLGVPLSPQVKDALVKANLPLISPDRSNGQSKKSPFNNGFYGDATTPGTRMPNLLQQQYFVSTLTRAILPMFVAEQKPFAIVYWSRDPDGTQHYQGDSLNSLTPGINGSTSKNAVRNVDENLHQLLNFVETNPTLRDNTDIFITSDHGFSTISKRDLDATGQNFTASYAATLSYRGVLPGHLPNGFVAIDIAHALNLPLYAANELADDNVHYARIDYAAGELPKDGDALIGGNGLIDRNDAKMIIAANGGADLIYVRDRDPALTKQVVNFLSQQDYTSGVFVDDAVGTVPGALPLGAIHLKGEAKLPTPTIFLNFRTFATNPKNPFNSEVEIADYDLQQGQGMHGSFGRGDTYNTMIAVGPDFKTGFVDPDPVGNTDVAITLAHIAGLPLHPIGEMTGRILEESLINGPASLPTKTGIDRSTPAEGAGPATLVQWQQVGDTRYFDAAGYEGRTVGLIQPQQTALSDPSGR